MSTPKLVPMLSPDGQAGQIPEDRVAEATKAGFKQGVLLKSPQGHVGVVPIDKGADALKAGFLPADGISAPDTPDALVNRMPTDVSAEDYAAMTPVQRAAFDSKVRSARLHDLPGDAASVATGAAKGLGTTLLGAANLINKVNPARVLGSDEAKQNLAKADQAVKTAKDYLESANTAESIGKGAEQAGEFLLPGALAGKVGKATSALPLLARIAARGATGFAANSALSAAHGDENPLLTGAVGAGGEAAAEALPTLAGSLTDRARKLYGKALAPTTFQNKAITAKIVPELLDQGEWGGLRTLSNKAKEEKADIGPQIDAALQAKGNVPQPVKPILDSLKDFRDSFISSNGTYLNKGAIKAVDELRDQLVNMSIAGGRSNGYISTADLVAARRVWDESVARAGGYAGKTLAEGSMVDAMREGANSIRRELAAAHPDLAAINAKYSFWSNVQRVADATLLRRQGQVGGLLGEGAAELGSAVIGGAKGGVKGMVLNAARKAAISPAARTARAVAWNKLGSALASNNLAQAGSLAKTLATAATSAAQDKDGGTLPLQRLANKDDNE